MAVSFTWTPKQNAVDSILASDVNTLATAIAAIITELDGKASASAIASAIAAITKSNVGLGNVTNESKATMFTSPTLTGTPLVPTASADTDTTQAASTAFVLGQAGDTTPIINSNTGAAGTSEKYSRADHSHPATSAIAKATGDVSIAVANTWYTGAGISLAAGTYLINAQITLSRSTTTALTYSARISDGSTHYASAGAYMPSVANAIMTIPLTTILTLTGATTINVQATATQTATIKKALVSNGAGDNATQITAIRLY